MESSYEIMQNTAFRNYTNRVERSVKSDPSSFWTFIKKRRQSSGVPQEVNYRGIAADSAVEAASLFADFFKGVHSSIPPVPQPETFNSITMCDINLPQLLFSVDDVYSALTSVDPSKGPGPDNLPPSFVKECAVQLAAPLAIIFNHSLISGIFPTAWKLASLTPIHKSGSIHNVENYRPISILNCLSKVFEKMVHTTLYKAVSPYISIHQHGFVCKRSTTSNLMTFTTDLIRKIEKRMQVDAVYIDFSKAFDRVPHTLAVEKLRRMGLPEWILQWLISYLTTRSAFVKVNGTQSDCFQIPSGVPQGSHLGPLIFVLFVNDLCALIGSSKLMYADDLKIYRTIVSLLDCCALQKDIDAVLRWCDLNGMEANISKCKTITFTRLHSPLVHGYKMGTRDLERVTSMKDLGIVVDSKVKFNDHISTVTAKAFALLGFIRRNTTSFEDIYALKSLYCSLVRSGLEYAVQVWAPYHADQASRIEKIQRHFVKFALRRLPWTDPAQLPPYEHRCMLIDLKPLAARRKTLQRMFIFDLVSGNIDCPDLLYQICFHAPQYRLRNPALLWLPGHRTAYGYNAPLNMCCRLFNEVCNEFDFNLSKSRFNIRIRNIP